MPLAVVPDPLSASGPSAVACAPAATPPHCSTSRSCWILGRQTGADATRAGRDGGAATVRSPTLPLRSRGEMEAAGSAARGGEGR
eukprot:scaffold14508_cov112-Isochrysis_galbana.AAC.3